MDFRGVRGRIVCVFPTRSSKAKPETKFELPELKDSKCLEWLYQRLLMCGHESGGLLEKSGSFGRSCHPLLMGWLLSSTAKCFEIASDGYPKMMNFDLYLARLLYSIALSSYM